MSLYRHVRRIVRNQRSDVLGDPVRTLDADHELQFPAVPVVPGERALRLQEDRVDRLRLEIAIEHQLVRAHILEFVLDLISVKRRLGIGGGRLRRRSPLRLLLHVARRPGPSGNERGVDIVTVRRRPGDAHEVIGVVGVLPRPARSGRLS